MQTFSFVLVCYLLINLAAGLWRLLKGPTEADRMLAAQLFGTLAVAILLLLGMVQSEDALRDVALVFALLAAVTASAFVLRFWAGARKSNHDA